MSVSRQDTIDAIRKFNRYYTVFMDLLNSNYLETDYSLTEIRVLFELWTNKKSIQDNIVKALNIDKSYLSRILKRFEKNSLIQKDDNATDKRKVNISLTAAGEREVQNLFEQTNNYIGAKIAKLNEAQRGKLCEGLSAITDLLKRAEQTFEVVPFEERYQKYFIEFNVDWISTYFGKVEKHDIEEFENIDDDIKKGAMIFFAVDNGNVLATCMAKPLNDSTWEICKLGSNKKLPRKGAGSAVFEACMNWALRHGAKRLFIISNSTLKPALHIYRKFGFQEIKLSNYQYERGDIAFEYLI